MPRVSVPGDRIVDGTLPSVCIICGDEASHRRLPGVSAPSARAILTSPLITLLLFWSYILRSSLSGGRTFGSLHASEEVKVRSVVVDRYTHHELGEVMAIADQMPALDLSVLMDVELGISQGISRVVPK